LVTSIISAIVAYLAGLVFFIIYTKERKTNRLIWGIAFIMYAIGHTIVVIITAISLSVTSQSYLFAMWLYVNISGAGTTGLILYSTFPFITEKTKIKVLVTGIFAVLYIFVSALLAFVLPANNPLAIVNLSGSYSQLGNMSWWVIWILIPASFFIGIIFIRHFKISGGLWGLLIGLSFVIYAIVLFIWPIPALKPIFYIIRTISVGLLGLGGILLAREK
jgi:hypothetical protein